MSSRISAVLDDDAAEKAVAWLTENGVDADKIVLLRKEDVFSGDATGDVTSEDTGEEVAGGGVFGVAVAAAPGGIYPGSGSPHNATGVPSASAATGAAVTGGAVEKLTRLGLDENQIANITAELGNGATLVNADLKGSEISQEEAETALSMFGARFYQ